MASSIETRIWMALKARIGGLEDLTGLTISWPNESFSAPEAGYIRVTWTPNVPQRMFHRGADAHARLGVLQILVLSRKNERASVAIDLAAKVAEHFPADLTMRFEATTVKVRQAPYVGPVVPVGAYAEVAVNVQIACYSL